MVFAPATGKKISSQSFLRTNKPAVDYERPAHFRGFVHRIMEIVDHISLDELVVIHPFVAWTLVPVNVWWVQGEGEGEGMRQDSYTKIGIETTQRILHKCSELWGICSVYIGELFCSNLELQIC